MSEPTHAPAAVQNVESLRMVRAAEMQAESRVAQATADVTAAIQHLTDEAEGAVRQARTESDAARESAVTEARTRGDAEAAAIVAEGRKAAQQIEVKASQTVAAKRDAVLDIVLGEFRSSP
jgi:vacuolar-type H+-ATPase subunit H